jgi:hypothetical protein
MTQIEMVLNTLYKISHNLIVCGDFNVNSLDITSKAPVLKSLLQSFGLENTVNFPTRIMHSSQTLRDYIFLNKKTLYAITYPLINGISDHDGQIVTLLDVFNPPKTTSFVYVRVIIDLSLQKFTELLSHETWNDIFSNDNTNEIFNYFLDTYLKIYYTCFPIKRRVRHSNLKPWLTQGIRISCLNKRKLYEKLKYNGDTRLKLFFKKYCKILMSTIKASKKLHYDNLISKSVNKTKTTWNIIKESINKNNGQTIIKSIKFNNNIIREPKLIADSFNTYFSTVAHSFIQKPLKNIHNSVHNVSSDLHKPNSVLYLNSVSTGEVYKIIQSLHNKNSSGYDEITSKILKISAVSILSPLTYIFNNALRSGIFPDRMKYSIIKPLHKKGTTDELENYRPISLLSSFSKIFEKIIYKRLYVHLEKHKILSPNQYGFREGLSTYSAINPLLDSILNAFKEKKFVGCLFCDIHKAFDCVNHEILLTKLLTYGITGTSNTMIQSYLKNRYQQVVIMDDNNINSYSNWTLIKQGVPQGSVLGPLLFLIYINDLALILNSHANPILFADDTSVIISSSNKCDFENTLNLVINEIFTWCKINSLTLNIEKTKFMQFYRYNQKGLDLQILINNQTINNVTEIGFLGLHLDNKLSWKLHSHELISKLNKACYAIRAMKPLVSHKALMSIYYAYFHSVMKYGIMFWGNSSFSHDVFKVQKRVIRLITNSYRRESCRPLFKKLEILTLFSQYILSVLVYLTNNMHLFTYNREIYSINTRNSCNLHLKSTNLSVVQKGVVYSGCKLFNSLPIHLKAHSENPKQFSKSLKIFLLEHSIYSLDEYYHITKL